MLKGECTIRCIGEYNQNWVSHLTLLYFPLIKNDAFIVYEVLHSIQGNQQTIKSDQILTLCDMTARRFKAARETLEEFSLLKTYYDAIHQSYLFQLYPPKTPNVFLRHDTMGRLLINVLGSQRYNQLCIQFAQDHGNTENMTDISKEMDISRLDGWNESKEIAMARCKPKEEMNNPMYPFDCDTFLTGMDRIFPYRLRTKENLSRIAQLASIYGISEKDMKKYVQRCIRPSTHEFNLEFLEELVSKNRTVSPEQKDPYSMAPIQFLLSKQKSGGNLAAADKHLVEKLCTDYNFSYDVVNVLIEYVLTHTNQKFTASYVEKVAATWSRLGIKNREDALQHISEEKTERKEKPSQLPSWYDQIPEEKASEELLAQALEFQKKLKGE